MVDRSRTSIPRQANHEGIIQCLSARWHDRQESRSRLPVRFRSSRSAGCWSSAADASRKRSVYTESSIAVWLPSKKRIDVARHGRYARGDRSQFPRSSVHTTLIRDTDRQAGRSAPVECGAVLCRSNSSVRTAPLMTGMMAETFETFWDLSRTPGLSVCFALGGGRVRGGWRRRLRGRQGRRAAGDRRFLCASCSAPGAVHAPGNLVAAFDVYQALIRV